MYNDIDKYIEFLQINKEIIKKLKYKWNIRSIFLFSFDNCYDYYSLCGKIRFLIIIENEENNYCNLIEFEDDMEELFSPITVGIFTKDDLHLYVKDGCLNNSDIKDIIANCKLYL